MGRRYVVHNVNGVLMTRLDVSERLGVSMSALNAYMARRKDGRRPTLEEAWEYYAAIKYAGVRIHRGPRARRHEVHGEWITVKEAARRAGMTSSTFYKCMNYHGFTLEQAVDYVNRRKENRAVKRILEILSENEG